jgi:hypothetical protein
VDVGELVEGLLEREVTDAMATQPPGEPQTAPARDGGVQLIPLRGRVRTHDVVVGIAALFTHAGQPVDRGRTLVLARAIAARLLQSGDVRGRVVATDA